MARRVGSLSTLHKWAVVTNAPIVLLKGFWRLAICACVCLCVPEGTLKQHLPPGIIVESPPKYSPVLWLECSCTVQSSTHTHAYNSCPHVEGPIDAGACSVVGFMPEG